MSAAESYALSPEHERESAARVLMIQNRYSRPYLLTRAAVRGVFRAAAAVAVTLAGWVVIVSMWAAFG